jgi:hypothetical protein
MGALEFLATHLGAKIDGMAGAVDRVADARDAG